MGAQQSTDITKFSDACSVHTVVDKFEVISPESNYSPSVLSILTLNNTATYDGIKLENAFMKSWITSNEFKDGDPTKAMIGGLDYERRVYKYIIRDLVDHDICPNFVRYLSAGRDCSFDDLLKIFEGDKNNLYKTIWDGTFAKYRQEDNEGPSEDVKKKLAASKYMTLITEYKEKPVSLYKLIRERPDDYNANKWAILFQVCVATYVMYLSGTAHNDLHLGNIMCEELEEKRKVTYVVDDEVYTFETKFIPRIFDFDRSYNKQLMKNKFLEFSRDDEKSYCESFGACNKVVDKRDFAVVMGYIMLESGDDIIARIIAHEDDKDGKYYKTVLGAIKIETGTNAEKHRQFLLGIDQKFCTKNVRGHISALRSISKLGDFFKNGTTRPSKQHFYTCSRHMFDKENGALKLDVHPRRNKDKENGALKLDVHPRRNKEEIESLKKTHKKNVAVAAAAATLATGAVTSQYYRRSRKNQEKKENQGKKEKEENEKVRSKGRRRKKPLKSP
jgi:hypothetical protein